MTVLPTVSAALIGLAGWAVAASPAAARDYPWCVTYSGVDSDGGVHCMFDSYRQCLQTATPGSGGNCVQNPYLVPPRGADQPRSRH